MTFSKMYPTLLAVLTGTTLFFLSCKKDESPSNTRGQLNLEITDGPCDDPNVKAVFITIAEVKVDGQTFSGFSGKKTINILAYQQGDVAALGLGELEAGSYQNITLVLDTQSDDTGASPGCYVQTLDNVKHALSSTATVTISATKSFIVEAGSKTDMVLDLDLRKAVQYGGGGGSGQYSFVGTASLQTALRLVSKNESAHLIGVCQNSILNTDKIVAYAYKKGTFNRQVELQTENGVAFKNAITSTALKSNGEFTIAFLESGEYEIHFAAYKDLNSDDKLDFQGTLILNSLIDLGNIQVAGSASVQLSVTVIGILP